MGQLIFITGGVRSGKSSFAAKIAQKNEKDKSTVAFLATAICNDDEMRVRIQQHAVDRPKNWQTYECPFEIEQLIKTKQHDIFIIDCLTMFLSNLLLNCLPNFIEEQIFIPNELCANAEILILNRVNAILKLIKARSALFIVVSNEVGSGIVPKNALARFYRDIVGMANREIAEYADIIYYMICGVPLKIKGE